MFSVLFGRHNIDLRAWMLKSQQEVEHGELKAWAQEEQVSQKRSTEQDLKVIQEPNSPCSRTSCEDRKDPGWLVTGT